ncbi:MAG: hypothetical protein ACI3ZN_04795 [Candidatus Cryptobacteroides sp.]
MTDREIREFIKTNASQASDNDRFMAELTRRMDCLPTPAAFTRDTPDTETVLAQLKLVMKQIRRRERVKGIVTLAMYIILSIALFCVIWLLSASGLIPQLGEGLAGVLTYVAGGAVCLLILAFSIKVTGLLEL